MPRLKKGKVRWMPMLPGKSRGSRTDWIVFEHTQRLMRSRSLHCAVVARHGHRDEAHHDGARLCCSDGVVSAVLRILELRGSIRGRRKGRPIALG